MCAWWRCEHILLPESLETNEFVDVRILFPSGENMIVLSKKKIERFIRDETGGEKVWLKLNEKEILLLSKAPFHADRGNQSEPIHDDVHRTGRCSRQAGRPLRRWPGNRDLRKKNL